MVSHRVAWRQMEARTQSRLPICRRTDGLISRRPVGTVVFRTELSPWRSGGLGQLVDAAGGPTLFDTYLGIVAVFPPTMCNRDSSAPTDMPGTVCG